MQDTWQKYWSEDAEFVQVFTDKQGNKNVKLVNHWNAMLSDLADNDVVLDIACGASSIFRDYKDAERLACWGSDISQSALDKLKTDLPYVSIYCSPLDKIDIPDAKVDMLCSQFGFEYAGIDAMHHIARLLKTGGKLQLISHFKNGYIDQNTQRKLTGINKIIDTQFLGKAFAVAKAFKRDVKEEVILAVDNFSHIEPSVFEICTNIPSGQHVHIYESVKELLSSFNTFSFESIENWFANTQQQLDENHSRLISMHNACLDDNDIQQLAEICKLNKVTAFTAKPFYLDSDNPPLAWNIHGIKS